MPSDIDYLSRMSPTPTEAVKQWIAATTAPLPSLQDAFPVDKPGGILTNLEQDMSAFDARIGGKLDMHV